jgi:hypothetical protein
MFPLPLQGGGEYALPWANMLRPYRAIICVDTFACVPPLGALDGSLPNKHNTKPITPVMDDHLL